MLRNRIYMFGMSMAVTALVGIGCTAAEKSENIGNVYKVEKIGGVPRLMENGEPRRSRMLYVSPTYFLLGKPHVREMYAGKKWLETWVEIPALNAPIKDGAIEFAPRANSFECYISKLVLVEDASGKKVWELDVNAPEKQATFREGGKNGSIKSEIKKFGFEDKDVRAAVIKSSDKAVVSFNGISLEKGKKYRIDIVAKSNGKRLDFDLYYAKDGKFLEPQTRSMIGIQTKIAAENGVDIVTFPVQAADFMQEDGSMNFDNLKGALDEIVAANPNVKILLRIRFYPPEWWLKKYPDDVMQNNMGIYSTFPCPSSQRFRDDSVKVLETVIDYCEKHYNKNMFGYHPGGGNSCEWFYGNTWSKLTYGYNKSAVDAWKRWVEKKYKTDEALQKAWNDTSATLANVKVPTNEERLTKTFILDIKTKQRIIDYNKFLQDEMVDMVETLGKTIRRKAPNRISALFYGYTCEFASVWKGAASSGHFALWRIAKSPYFDMLSGPVSYYKRHLGDDGATMGTSETITRCGKIWFDEDDIRTHRTPPSQQTVLFGKELRTLEDTVQVLQRDLARQAIRNHSCWWMDLSGTGWYDDPRMWKLMPDFDKIEKDMIENPIVFAPEVAYVIDERSACYIGAGAEPEGKGSIAKYTTMMIRTSRNDLSQCSVPYGHFVFEDFLYGKKMNPKLAIFPMNYALNAKERKLMRKKTKDIGALFVWIPAYIDLNKKEYSTKATKEATGYDVEVITDMITAELKSTDEGKRVGLPEKFGFDAKIRPLLSPILKDGDVVLATYQNEKPAVVRRGKHIFCGVADIPLALYRHATEISGAHIYTKSGESVWASGAYISITCMNQNEGVHDVEIDIPSDKEIFDAITGEKLGVAPKLALKMKKGDNRVLRLGSGNAEFTKK